MRCHLIVTLGMLPLLYGCTAAPAVNRPTSAKSVNGSSACIEGPCPDGGSGTESLTGDGGAAKGDGGTTVTPTPPPPTPSCATPDLTALLNGAGLQNAPNKNLSRPDTCLDCHDGSNSSLPAFDFGGRVYDKATGKGRAGVIVAVPSAGGGIRVVTNADGLFWWPPPPSGGYDCFDFFGLFPCDPATSDHPSFPTRTGVKDPTGIRAMCALAPTGNCGSCHDGKTTSVIY